MHKEKIPTLVIGLRETPLSAIHWKTHSNWQDLACQSFPVSPAFINGDNSFEGMVNFVAGKALDQLKIDHQLFKRWKEGEDA